QLAAAGVEYNVEGSASGLKVTGGHPLTKQRATSQPLSKRNPAVPESPSEAMLHDRPAYVGLARDHHHVHEAEDVGVARDFSHAGTDASGVPRKPVLMPDPCDHCGEVLTDLRCLCLNLFRFGVNLFL